MSYASINELPAAALARYRAKLQICGLETCPYQQPTNRVVGLSPKAKFNATTSSDYSLARRRSDAVRVVTHTIQSTNN